MDGREARKGANEAWFRDLNERLERRAADRVTPAPEFEAICECSDEECTDRIPIAFADYERIRANPRAFLVQPSHADPESERVLSSRGGFAVVEKIGPAGAVAELEDPRNDVGA